MQIANCPAFPHPTPAASSAFAVPSGDPSTGTSPAPDAFLAIMGCFAPSTPDGAPATGPVQVPDHANAPVVAVCPSPWLRVVPGLPDDSVAEDASSGRPRILRKLEFTGSPWIADAESTPAAEDEADSIQSSLAKDQPDVSLAQVSPAPGSDLPTPLPILQSMPIVVATSPVDGTSHPDTAIEDDDSAVDTRTTGREVADAHSLRVGPSGSRPVAASMPATSVPSEIDAPERQNDPDPAPASRVVPVPRPTTHRNESAAEVPPLASRPAINPPTSQASPNSSAYKAGETQPPASPVDTRTERKSGPALDPITINRVAEAEVGAASETESASPAVPQDAESVQTALISELASPRPGLRERPLAHAVRPLAAKFAEDLAPLLSDGVSAPGASIKKALSPATERVKSVESTVGTGTAKTQPAMPAPTFSRHDAPVISAPTGTSVPPPVAELRDSTQPAVQAPALAEHVRSAEHAVEAVMSAVERFTSGDRHAVNLEFSIGGSDLHVRVELRADEVHTAFRTASPELRAALTQEWQTVAARPSEHAMRFVAPVFSASSGGDAGLSNFSGGAAWQHQRESAPQPEAQNFFPGFSRSSASTAAAVEPAKVTPSAAPAWFGPERRLQTFA